MSLPAATELNTLSYVSEGQPFAAYQPSTADTLTMSFVFAGQPFYAQGTSVAASVRPVIFTCT